MFADTVMVDGERQQARAVKSEATLLTLSSAHRNSTDSEHRNLFLLDARAVQYHHEQRRCDSGRERMRG